MYVTRKIVLSNYITTTHARDNPGVSTRKTFIHPLPIYVSIIRYHLLISSIYYGSKRWWWWWYYGPQNTSCLLVGSEKVTTTILQPFFRDHPGEPVPEQNFWTLWCKGRLTEADTLTIRLGVTPSGLTSAHLHHPPIFLQAGCPSCCPTNSVKALKATSAFA